MMWWMAAFFVVLGMGWYRCCCGTAVEPCSFCDSSTTPTNVSLTITGWTNDDCDCSDVNDTFIIPKVAACQWYDVVDTSTSCRTGNVRMSFNVQVQQIGGLARWGVIVYVGDNAGGTSTNASYRWIGSGTTIDCSTARTLTVFNVTLGFPQTCGDPTGLTLTLTPS